MYRLLSVLLAAAIPLGAMAAPQSYLVDPVHSFTNFTVNHFGMRPSMAGSNV